MLRVRLVINVMDSSGLEGIIPCMRAIQTYRDYGVAVATGILAQNNESIHGLYRVPLEHIGAQLEAVLHGYKLESTHVGYLPDIQSARLVADVLSQYQVKNVVFDPSMETAQGLKIFSPESLPSLVEHFTGRVMVLTPNIPEAEALVGRSLEDMNAMKEAAPEIYEHYHPEFLIIKGGHLPSLPRAIDLIFDGKRSYLIDQPWQRGRKFAGMGDTFATLIAIGLSEGNDIHHAVDRAKRFVVRAMQHTFIIGSESGFQPLNHNIPKI